MTQPWWCRQSILTLIGGVMSIVAPVARAELPMLSAKGTQLVDPAGREVLLRGCNLGNYLMLEGWMFGGTLDQGGRGFKDGATVYRTLRERFGAERAAHLVELYRENWITPRDFEVIKSFGFNVVRLPFDYRLIQEDASPFTTRADAFRWLDRAVDMAERAGVYTILDLHGVPGGQSINDHTGEAGQNKLWESAENQRRTVDVWRTLAEHFKNRASVAAYDLINEPYSDHKMDVRPVLSRLMPEVTRAIRDAGDRHVVYFPGGLNSGIAFYGNPHSAGLENVAFTEHYYPGLFGSKPALETQARMLGQRLPRKRAELHRIDSPYLVGEFNVVLAEEDPARMMRAYYDRFAEFGWAGTMWSYKLLSEKGGVGSSVWYMATNEQPLPKLDLDTAAYEQLESFFKSFATMPLVANVPLREALTTPTPAPIHLARPPKLPTTVPADLASSDPAGHTSADIGDARVGFTSISGDLVTLLAAGADIFGPSDSFRFVSRAESEGAIERRATITQLLESSDHAKAGVMVRWGDRPDAAMAFAFISPDGGVALSVRRTPGERAAETKLAVGVATPVELRLRVDAGRATADYRLPGGEWQPIGAAEVPTSGERQSGLAACSQDREALTRVTAVLDEAADAALDRAAVASAKSLLAANTSSWHPDGSAFSGDGFDPAAAASTMWQDVAAVAGHRYTFSIEVVGGADVSGSIELRLESTTIDGRQVTLNLQTFDLARLPRDGRTARLSVAGTAYGDRVRAVVATPKKPTPGAGRVTLRNASLVEINMAE